MNHKPDILSLNYISFHNICLWHAFTCGMEIKQLYVVEIDYAEFPSVSNYKYFCFVKFKYCILVMKWSNQYQCMRHGMHLRMLQLTYC